MILVIDDITTTRNLVSIENAYRLTLHESEPWIEEVSARLASFAYFTSRERFTTVRTLCIGQRHDRTR